MSKNDELVWIDAHILAETELAVRVDVGTKIKAWIPKSQIKDNSGEIEIGADIELEIPEWLASEKGLI